MSSNKLWYGPSTKIWSDTDCNNIGNYQESGLLACQEKCKNTNGCTAINYSSTVQNGCTLRSCIDNKQPTGDQTGNFYGYATYKLDNEITPTINVLTYATNQSGFVQLTGRAPFKVNFKDNSYITFDTPGTSQRVDLAGQATQLPITGLGHIGQTEIKQVDVQRSKDWVKNNGVKWLWDFNDGNTSTEQNPSHTFTKSGIYNVNLTVSYNGESKTGKVYTPIIVSEPSPLPVEEQTGPNKEQDIKTDKKPIFVGNPGTMSPTNGPSPLTIKFDFSQAYIQYGQANEYGPNSDLITEPISEWNWDFGDGTQSAQQNPEHVYEKPGIYTVTVRLSNGEIADTKTFHKPIIITSSIKQVEPEPAEEQIMIVPEEVVDGIPNRLPLPQPVLKKGDLEKKEEIIRRRRRDNERRQQEAEAEEQIIYKQEEKEDIIRRHDNRKRDRDRDRDINRIKKRNSGEWVPIIIAVPGSDPRQQQVLREELIPSFTASIVQGGDPLELHFIDTSKGEPMFWQWDFGDNSPKSNIRNPIHRYERPGIYKVRMYVTNDYAQNQLGRNAVLSASADITVGPKEIAPVVVEMQPPIVCPPGCEPIETFQNIEGFEGGFWAWLTSWFTGTKVQQQQQVGSIKPMFTVSRKQDDDYTMYFEDTSSCIVEGKCILPTKFKWDFGDNTMSVEQDPIHTYKKEGTYTVTLTVYDESIGDYVPVPATALVPVIKSPELAIDKVQQELLVCPTGCKPIVVEGFGKNILSSSWPTFLLLILLILIVILIMYYK